MKLSTFNALVELIKLKLTRDHAISIKGDRGEIGPQGLIGPQGPRGEIGPRGPQGLRGTTGPVGDAGPRGDLGPKGEKGDQGERGIAGPQGAKGDRGDQGPRGDRGVNWRGQWQRGVRYAEGDGVQHYGSSWIALRATSFEPGQVRDWDLLAARGASGGPGAQGLQGPAGVDGDAADIVDEIHAASTKASPADDDELGLLDSAAAFVLKKWTWANIKTAILAWLQGQSPTLAGLNLSNQGTGEFKQQVRSNTTLTADRTVNLPATDGNVTLVSTSNKLSALAATTSAELAGVVSDETGSGALVFGTNPTLRGSGNAGDTKYTVVTLSGSAAANANISRYSTTGVTNSAKTIFTVSTYGILIIVNGYDAAGGRMFTDLLLAGAIGNPTVVSSRTEFGSPASRSYTLSGSNIQLTMGASGNYSVTATAIEGSFQP